jgi:hypothetical protein
MEKDTTMAIRNAKGRLPRASDRGTCAHAFQVFIYRANGLGLTSGRFGKP